MNFVADQVYSCKQAWRTILTKPLEHLVNIAVLAIIIAICLWALAIGNNLNHWQQNNLIYPQLIIYLDKNATPSDKEKIDQELHKLSAKIIGSYSFISKQQALKELQQDKELSSIASGPLLTEQDNPLPDVFIVEIKTTNYTEIKRINLQLSQLPKVDNTHIDLNYANKVNDLTYFATTLTTSVQLMSILIVMLVVYNFIRLQMLVKVDAITVSRLIGASDSFIMRPLIHYAVWQVTLATAMAIIFTHFLMNHLNRLLTSMNSLFGKGITITQLPYLQLVIFWLILTVFSIFTVFLAVRWVFRNISKI